MKRVEQDVMYEAIARMKFGMTVAEATTKGICIDCKQVVLFHNREYEHFGFCPDCVTRAKTVDESGRAEAGWAKEPEVKPVTKTPKE